MDNFGNIVQNIYTFGQDGDDRGFCQCIMEYKVLVTITKKWVVDNTISAIPPAKTGMRLDVKYFARADKRSMCTALQWSDSTTSDFQKYPDQAPGAGKLSIKFYRYLKCNGCKETTDIKGIPNCGGGGKLCEDEMGTGGKAGIPGFSPPTEPGTPWTPKAKELLEDMWTKKYKLSSIKKIMKNFIKMFKKCGPLLRCQDSKCPD